MKGIKKNKKTIIISIAILLIFLTIFLTIFFIIPSFGNNKYGNRLDAIDKHKVSNSSISDIKNEIKTNEGVTKVTYNKEGRILNFIITLDGSVELETAKKYTDAIIDNISKDNLKYYDVQVFLEQKEKQGFPIAGYKHKTSSQFSFGNVGEVSE